MGSTDGSKQIILKTLKDLALRGKVWISRIYGVVKTRNKGIEPINENIFLFVDSDDYLPDDYVKELLFMCNKSTRWILFIVICLIFEKNRNLFKS